MECGKLLYVRSFSLRMRGAVYMSYVKSEILYRSEAWCLKESDIGILQRTEGSIVRAMDLMDRRKLWTCGWCWI